jgi:outer membrane lipoprotein-sorting protein
MKTASLLLSLLCLSPALAQDKKLPAPAKIVTPKVLTIDTSHKDLVQMVNSYWNSVRYGHGKFVQVTMNGKRTEGELYFNKPGQLLFDYNPPSKIEIIADGKTVAVRDKKLNTQDIYPISQTPLQFLLADKMDVGKDPNVTSITRDADFIFVRLEEKKAIGGTHRLVLVFSVKDMKLSQWTITDPQGHETSVAVHNLNVTQRPTQDHFKIDYQKYN